MEKNRLLNLAALLCNILRVLAIAFIAVVTLMLIYWHINPGFYEFIKVPQPGSGFSLKLQAATLTTTFGKTIESGANSNVVAVATIASDTVYLLYLQTVGLALLWLLILKQVKRILTSVQGLQTFRESNSSAFRKIAWYCFYIFLLSAFEWLHTDTTYFIAIHLDAVPLIFMLISFILAEVFEEGNKLYEEERLTI